MYAGVHVCQEEAGGGGGRSLLLLLSHINSCSFLVLKANVSISDMFFKTSQTPGLVNVA